MEYIFRSWNEDYKMFIYFRHGCYFKDIGGKYTVLSSIDIVSEFWSNKEQGSVFGGKQYFEGDIFKTFLLTERNKEYYVYHVLKFSEEKDIYLFIRLDQYKKQNYKSGRYLFSEEFTHGEKCIGNIHQNKELLGQKYCTILIGRGGNLST